MQNSGQHFWLYISIYITLLLMLICFTVPQQFWMLLHIALHKRFWARWNPNFKKVFISFYPGFPPQAQLTYHSVHFSITQIIVKLNHDIPPITHTSLSQGVHTSYSLTSHFDVSNNSCDFFLLCEIGKKLFENSNDLMISQYIYVRLRLFINVSSNFMLKLKSCLKAWLVILLERLNQSGA